MTVEAIASVATSELVKLAFARLSALSIPEQIGTINVALYHLRQAKRLIEHLEKHATETKP